MWEDIQAAIPLGFFLSFMIGPVFFVLIQTSVLKGFRAALVFDLGVIVADVLFITVAYFSSFQLLRNLSNQPGLYVFGGVILFIYGVTTLVKRENKGQAMEGQLKIKTKRGYLELFVKGFLLNFINIGVLVFWLGVILVVGPNLGNDSGRMTTFFATMIIAYFITDLFKILLAKQLKQKLTTKRIRLVKKALGIILIICGLVLITKGFLPMDKFNLEKGLEHIENIK